MRAGRSGVQHWPADCAGTAYSQTPQFTQLKACPRYSGLSQSQFGKSAALQNVAALHANARTQKWGRTTSIQCALAEMGGVPPDLACYL